MSVGEMLFAIRDRWWILCIATAVVQCEVPPAPADDAPTGNLPIERFEERVIRNPGDASGWRMLGRVREQGGDQWGALEAFAEAAALDPLSAAARFDLARVYLETGQDQAAADAFAEAARLAPDSSYAQQARAALTSLPAPAGEIQQAGFEIRRFDGADRVDSLLPPADRLRRSREPSETLPPPLSLRLEAGVLYNTNVALAPTSRGLATAEQAGFQAFANPDVEWAGLNTAVWRAGPTFQGYFNLNEEHLRGLNLQSYQPGLFVERMIVRDAATLLPRLAYAWTHDAFDGRTFANRHAATLSTTAIWPNLNETTIYWATDFTDFADDGVDPAVTSADGWTNTIGASHRCYVEQPWLRSLSAGVEGQRADTDGANFRYEGIGLYGDAEIPVSSRLTLFANAGWSFRSYPDADLSPPRDEHIWHAGARLRLDINDCWSAAVVLNWDRFDSENDLFTTGRTVAGIMTTFDY